MPAGESIANHIIEVGGGVTVADLTNDGLVDVLFMQNEGPNELYRGVGDGTFVRVPNTGLELPWEHSVQSSAADYDADGDLDVVITGYNLLRLFRNDGEIFTDVSAEVGLGETPGLGTTTAWADIDGDGDLDLYNGIYAVDTDLQLGTIDAASDGLWRNDGGAFVDVSDGFIYPGGTDGAVLLGLFRDMDEDGDPDLLQINDLAGQGADSFLWENLGLAGAGPEWRDRLEGSGVGGVDYPMGVSVADLDGDGLRDLVITNIGAVHAFQGWGTFSWVDTSLTWLPDLPTDGWRVSWSAVPIDLDGDGRSALYLSYGPLTCPAEDFDPPPPTLDDYLLQPDELLVPAGAGDSFRLERSTSAFPFAPTGSGRAVAAADLNGDGTADVLVGNLGGPPTVFLSACTDASRLVVRPRIPGGSNPHAIGARVLVEAGGSRQFAEVSAGGPGSGASLPPEVLFGLGAASTVDRLEVTWPDGEVSEFSDLCAHCVVTVTRGQDG